MPIEARDLVKRFASEPRNVLDHVSLGIGDGEFVSLIGRSGSGKSTLLYLLSTLDSPTGGQVLFDGDDVSKLGVREVHALRNRRIGFIFQFHYLLPELTAIENVLMPARKSGQSDARADRARELLDTFGLAGKEHRFPSQLSGGEQQRVAVARALIMDPAYLFADEPTGNLDTASGDRVMEILQRSNREKKTSIVLVTHDPDYARLAHRQIHLADGQIR